MIVSLDYILILRVIFVKQVNLYYFELIIKDLVLNINFKFNLKYFEL